MAEPKDQKPPRVPTEISRRKRLLFGAICLLAPLLFLGLLEAVLRVAGLGGYPPIFRPVGPTDNGTLVITDPAGAVSWFFANPQRPGYNEQYSFLMPKPAGTVRIITVGESAMKGYPEPRNLAVSAFLREMLQDAWPDKKVEVINLGTTAVASFPVLGIMTEALDYSPDLVVIHTGHNEFFGTYGVASIGLAGGKPWMLRTTRFIHSLALLQGLEKLLPGRKTSQDNKTLMQLMIGRSCVPPRDWRRAAAASNLGHNVAEMVARCKARGVPVLVCTQPCNEKDLAPVGPDTPADSAARSQLESALLLMSQSPSNAAAPLRSLVQQRPDYARAHFYLGKALLGLGQQPEALSQFIQARDLDTLPWRTPSLSQRAIVRAAEENGAVVCDLEAAFRRASPDGCIGWDLMDDHVHPTLKGEALWARTLCASLAKFDGPLRVSPEAFSRLDTDEQYARRLGDNPFDRYGVAHSMRVIFDIPFMRHTNPQAYERFDALANSVETNYDVEIRAAMHEWQTAVPHAGGKRPLTGMVARVLMREGKYAEALELWRIAQQGVPDYTSWHMEYVYFALACEEKLHGSLSEPQKAEALAELQQGRFLLQHGFSEFGLADRYLGRLHQLRGEWADAIPYLMASRKKLNGNDLVAADQALAVSYLKTGQPEKARQLVEYGAEHSGQYSGMYQRMLADLPAVASTNADPKLPAAPQ